MSISGITHINQLQQSAYREESMNVSAPQERQAASESGNVLPQSIEKEVTRTEVTEAVRDILEYIPSLSRELQFQMDEDSSSPIITVRDAETMEVVRQIPSEEVVAIARYIAEVAPDALNGILLDGRG